MIETITSIQNQKIKEIKKLRQKKYRDDKKEFVIEGEHLLNEACKHNCLKLVVTTNIKYENKNTDVIYVSENVMKSLTALKSWSEYLGVCSFFKNEISFDDNIVVLDNVQDPGNVGTIIRNSLAFDCKNLILSKDCADIYNEKVIQASQGAIFLVNIVVCDLDEIIKELKSNNFKLVGTSLKKALKLELDTKINNKIAIFLGNEGQGLKDDIISAMDYNYYIEIKNIDSLNVASASAIIFYQFLIKR